MFNKKYMKTGMLSIVLAASLMVSPVYAAGVLQESYAADAGVNATQTEAPQTEASQAEAPQADTVQDEVPQTEPTQTETPQTEVPQTEAPQTEPSQTEPPQTEVLKPTPSQTEIPQIEPSPTEAPQTEAPKPVPPQNDPQKPASQQTEPQQPTVPQTETPQTEAPQTDAPQTETALPTQVEIQMEESEQSAETSAEVVEAVIEDDKPDGEDSEEEDDLPEGIDHHEGYSPYSTNEELLAHQHIVVPPKKEDFRFIQVEAPVSLLKKGTVIYEEQDEESRMIGKASEKCRAYVLEDDGDWMYVESGNVRGFALKESMLSGNVAELIYERDTDKAFSLAEEIIPAYKNKALCHTKTTVNEVVVDKEYAWAENMSVDIHEDKDNRSRVVGTIPQGGLAFVLADKGKNQVFVESGDVRGFVDATLLKTGKTVSDMVHEKNEDSFALAEQKVKPEDNRSCYYTITSTQKANEISRTRRMITEFALQFVGNPYVWGGTSLTSGADCSGFVQSVYAHFGYTLPRVACYQAEYGTQIPISEAEPGDLIFYSKKGYVYHVSMYLGEGQVVHAYSTKAGIIRSDIGPNAIWATRLLD